MTASRRECIFLLTKKTPYKDSGEGRGDWPHRPVAQPLTLTLSPQAGRGDAGTACFAFSSRGATHSDGVWRVAFAFDMARQAVVLVAGDKSCQSEGRFYRTLIARADERFDDHLARQKNGD